MTLLVVVAAACGGSGDDTVDAASAPTTATPSPVPSAATTAANGVAAPAPATAAPGTEPPTTEPPTTESPSTEPPSTEPSPTEAGSADGNVAEELATGTADAAQGASFARGGSGAFTFEASPITAEVAARMVGVSWREGCPVPLEGLRYLRIGYWGFDGAAHVGELVVNADAVDAMAGAFGRLFDAGFPIRRMQLVDDYGGDDDRSIDADNTSAFNCRAATGSSNWSQHAYGFAIDVNPIENPYVYGDGTTSHAASEPYLDRSIGLPGMAVEGGALVAAFDAVGWGWGGRWASPVDYQHFSGSGG